MLEPGPLSPVSSALTISPPCLWLYIFLFSHTGVDPKSVVCAFFKQGQCSKGDKCKFSHDLALDRKGEKRSLYVDARDVGEDELKNDTMDKWDQDKLEEVIEKKQNEKDKSMTKTEIVSDRISQWFIKRYKILVIIIMPALIGQFEVIKTR